MKSLVAVAGLLVGCTHHRPLADVSEVSGDVVIETIDHQVYRATATETLSGTVFVTNGGGVIDRGMIAKVTDERTLRGAAEGLGIGAGIGALGGIIIGYADGDDPECDHCWLVWSAHDKAVIGGIAFGLIGGFIGLATGTVRGSTVIYENENGPTVIPSGPPGSVAGLTFIY